MASTENAFYYLDKYDLCQKLVLIEDMDGVQYLLYPLRELQTKSWISKVVPLKDSKGNMKAQKLEVYGPICLSGTTTKERLYEDNANRCLLVHLDNSAEQQENIMAYQRAISAGRIDHNTEEEATRLPQNVQSVLEPIKVINPYAEQLKLPTSCLSPCVPISTICSLSNSDLVPPVPKARTSRRQWRGLYRNNHGRYQACQSSVKRHTAHQK